MDHLSCDFPFEWAFEREYTTRVHYEEDSWFHEGDCTNPYQLRNYIRTYAEDFDDGEPDSGFISFSCDCGHINYRRVIKSRIIPYHKKKSVRKLIDIDIAQEILCWEDCRKEKKRAREDEVFNEGLDFITKKFKKLVT